MHEVRDESKSEEDEPPTAVARQEAEADANRIVMKAPKALSKGATVPMSAIAPPAINQGADDAATAAPTVAISETTNEFVEASKNGKDEHHRQYEEHAPGVGATTTMSRTRMNSTTRRRTPTRTDTTADTGRTPQRNPDRHVTWTNPVADVQSGRHSTKNTARTKYSESMDVTLMPESNKKYGRKHSSAIASAQLGTDEMTDEKAQ
ncbi:unnamed protein product [Phytophthora fragariaefolia]|uniref:Unnamed protein product n=1 Tax=Phytophthora fragariaefolia TaxID=1490495 RepID=A0A9W7D4H0_9STRA|nr:unnamed protein product [Phytophthora fragariaefolia]